MRNAFLRIKWGLLDAIEIVKRGKPCPECKGWGIPDEQSCRRHPCPKCGAGTKRAD